MSRWYDGMLPAVQKEGRRGYYPVTSEQEWKDELPAVYKAMEWFPVKDPFNKGKLSVIERVIFETPYLEPYGVRAKIEVHRQEFQKIMFMLHEKTQCQLYSVCGVVLQSGTRLGAKWYQDTTTGAFAVYSNEMYVGKQGGFNGHIPECIEKLEDGSFKWKGFEGYKNINHYSF